MATIPQAAISVTRRAPRTRPPQPMAARSSCGCGNTAPATARRSSASPAKGAEAPLRNGATAARLLFDDDAERVLIEDWAPGASVTVPNRRGLELLVLSGALATGDGTLIAQGWCRLPAGHDFRVQLGPDGARVWLKDAPLQHPDVLPKPG